MNLKVYYSQTNWENDYLSTIENLLLGIPSDKIFALTLLGRFPDVEYHSLLSELKKSINILLHRDILFTLIPQSCLSGTELCVEIYTLDNIDSEIGINRKDFVQYSFIDNDDLSMILFEGIPSLDFSDSVKNQSNEVFCLIEDILSSHDMSVDDIVRQWNYVGNITDVCNGKQNYQEFNDARTKFYEKGKWKNGYPAATGIGASFRGIIVSGLAVKYKDSSLSKIYPIDNPLQIAAHKYSCDVLIDNDKDAVKSTPKFERAKVIELEDVAYCFVSGTAAIRGEKSLQNMPAEQQTIKTIENIKYLVSPENLVKYGSKPYDMTFCNLRVYIKEKSDYEIIHKVVEYYYPNIPVVYTHANVCRTELLVEIEGIMKSVY